MLFKPSRQQLIGIYRWSVIALGGFVVFDSLYHFSQKDFDYRIFVLAGFTAFVASQISIKIPRFNGSITVSDAFIFIALLLWGAPAAVLTAIADSVASTWKVSRKLPTYLFNCSSQALATWVSAFVLAIFFGKPENLAKDLPNSAFAIAICAIALSQYGVTTTIIAVMQALKMSQSVWLAWTRYYLWTCVTFFVGAAAAGLVVRFAGDVSLFSFAIVSPIIFLVYFTYRTYLKNLDALQESESRFRSSFDHATVGMALVSPAGRWLQINQSLRELLGESESKLLESRYQDIVHPEDLEQLEAKIKSVLNNEFPACQMEIRLLHPENRDIWALLSVSTAQDAQNAVRHLIFQIQDITLRKTAEEKLRYDASHDMLTRLPNRAAYTQKLQAALDRSKQRSNGFIAILFLDLDGFKLVNDSLGHGVGDDLLKGTAARLLECVRGRDTVARLGGDEFTILLEDLADIEQATRVAERVRQRLSEPFQLAGHEIFVGTSIGIATTEIFYQESGEMLRDADAAMYQAKARGKGCYVVFDKEMFANATRQLRLANDLRRAAERNELVVYYQPIHSLENNQVCGFEALLRWNHPAYGVLMPSEFIPVAEENGLINHIDNWVLAEACRQMREWQESNSAYLNLTVSVNISTKQFAQFGLVDNVKRVLMETGLQARCLQLEITESAMVKNLKNTAHVLDELTLMGIHVALDDFGTGYSSLSYLHELPISTLKIDRSFTNRISGEADGAQIVRAIVELARNLRMRVIAEGIETAEQLEQLRLMGCEFGQGYYFSRPVTAEETHKSLQSSQNFSNHYNYVQRGRLRLVSGG